MSRRIVRRAWLSVLAMGAAAALIGSTPALAQVPMPNIPDTNQRSGLLTRFVGVTSNLPPDPKRDTFYNTRWADGPCVRRPNLLCTSGLYGLRWKTACTACFTPYFKGSPGANTLTSGCLPTHPASRWVDNFIHPFKPVGSYYAGGCYVPIYDLDPLVTGPGTFPWPIFPRYPLGG